MYPFVKPQIFKCEIHKFNKTGFNISLNFLFSKIVNHPIYNVRSLESEMGVNAREGINFTSKYVRGEMKILQKRFDYLLRGVIRLDIHLSEGKFERDITFWGQILGYLGEIEKWDLGLTKESVS